MFGVMVGVLFSIAAVLIEYNYIQISKSFGQIPVYMLLTAQYTYFPFIYVAIWRSSNKYIGPSYWAALAKGATVLGVLMLVANAFKVYESDKVTEQNLLETADLLNRSLPIMVDNVTKLHRVSSEKNTLTYHYQIVGMNPSMIDPATIYKRMRPQLVSQACASPDMKPFFQNGVTVAYSYTGSNNIMLARIEVTPNDCGY
jgi:hypothetical protein